MAGFITHEHLDLIRSIYGEFVYRACVAAPETSTFLAILTAAQEEERTILANIDRYMDQVSRLAAQMR